VAMPVTPVHSTRAPSTFAILARTPLDVLVAGRNVFIATAALAGTAIAAALGATVILVALASALMLLIVLSRGFRGVTTL
jgi:hypothetical protein